MQVLVSSPQIPSGFQLATEAHPGETNSRSWVSATHVGSPDWSASPTLTVPGIWMNKSTNEKFVYLSIDKNFKRAEIETVTYCLFPYKDVWLILCRLNEAKGRTDI